MVSLFPSDAFKRPHSPHILDGAKRLRTDVNPQDAWLLELHSTMCRNCSTPSRSRQHITNNCKSVLPDRHSSDCQARIAGVLFTKLNVLRSCGFSSIASAPAPGLVAHPTHPDDRQIGAENENNEVLEKSNGIDVELRSLFLLTAEFLDRFETSDYAAAHASTAPCPPRIQIRLQNAGRPTEG